MDRRTFIRVAGISTAGALVRPIGASAAEGQEGWRWCKKCEGLWFAAGGEERRGKCPAGEGHDASESGRYTLVCNDANAPGQGGWRWCKKCEGLWLADGGEKRPGKCPAGEGHDTTDSGRYTLIHNEDDAPGQGGWRWCKKCEGLWFAGGGDDRKGKCPGKEGHEEKDSGRYILEHAG